MQAIGIEVGIGSVVVVVVVVVVTVVVVVVVVAVLCLMYCLLLSKHKLGKTFRGSQSSKLYFIYIPYNK